MRGLCRGAVLAVLLVAPSLVAAPPDAPESLTAKPGQLVRIVVKADEGKLATARNFKDSEAFWGELVGPKGQRQFVFQAPADGKRTTYVLSWTTVGELEGVCTTITIEGVTPPPPTDPLLEVLQAAYNAEPNSVYMGQSTFYNKTDDKTYLTSLMRVMAKSVGDPAVKTGDDNYTLLHNSAQNVIGDRLKIKLRPAIGAELNKVLPSGVGKGALPLTDQNRKDAAAFYTRIADLLEKVK